MNDIQKRFCLFLLFCIPARFGLAHVVRTFGGKYKKYVMIILLAIGIGFAYVYMTGIRKTGREVFGSAIWWNDARPIHALLYITAAILVFRNNKNAWKPLVFDTLLGLILFIRHHYVENNFSKLI